MTCHLLDVNVLIALVDPAHVEHELAHQWFGRVGIKAFATCPITQNGLLRIVGNPRYPNSPGPPSTVVAALNSICAMEGHQFWPDSIRMISSERVDATLLSSHLRVTDSYLLALARANHGRLATLDQKLSVDAVADGASVLMLIR